MATGLARQTVIVFGSTVLVACGGHGGSAAYSYGSCSYAGACYPYQYGAYRGAMVNPATGHVEPMLAVLGPAGTGRMAGQDGSRFRLEFNAVQNGLRGTLLAYAPAASTATGTYSAGSIAGTLDRDGLNATVLGQNGLSQGLNLQYAGATPADAAASPIGTWGYTAGNYNISLKMNADGSIVGTDSNACAYQGTISAVGPRLNLYRAQIRQDCGDGNAESFSGYLAPLDSATAAPEQKMASVAIIADDSEGKFFSVSLAQQR